MTVAIPRGLRREEGQGLVEYALIILLVSGALVGALTAFGVGLGGVYEKISLTIVTALG